MKTILSNVTTIIKNSPNLVFNNPDSYYVASSPIYGGDGTPAILKETWSSQLRGKKLIGIKCVPLDQTEKIYIAVTNNATPGTEKGSMTTLTFFETKAEDLGKVAIYYFDEPIEFSSGFLAISAPSSSGHIYISRRNTSAGDANINYVGCNNNQVITEYNRVLMVDFIYQD